MYYLCFFEKILIRKNLVVSKMAIADTNNMNKLISTDTPESLLKIILEKNLPIRKIKKIVRIMVHKYINFFSIAFTSNLYFRIDSYKK